MSVKKPDSLNKFCRVCSSLHGQAQMRLQMFMWRTRVTGLQRNNATSAGCVCTMHAAKDLDKTEHKKSLSESN